MREHRQIAGGPWNMVLFNRSRLHMANVAGRSALRLCAAMGVGALSA